ncbi:hypothetical protein BRC60_02520 [Halobacteriales archaeon QH_1_68_42]|nr:MAG: hypothetical protein BRC60_02520 [Halobacteriales archaeon QH_1_68_42]
MLQSRFMSQFPETDRASGFGMARTVFVLLGSVGNAVTGVLASRGVVVVFLAHAGVGGGVEHVVGVLLGHVGLGDVLAGVAGVGVEPHRQQFFDGRLAAYELLFGHPL